MDSGYASPVRMGSASLKSVQRMQGDGSVFPMGREGAVLVKVLAMIDSLEFHALAEFELLLCGG